MLSDIGMQHPSTWLRRMHEHRVTQTAQPAYRRAPVRRMMNVAPAKNFLFIVAQRVWVPPRIIDQLAGNAFKFGRQLEFLHDGNRFERYAFVTGQRMHDAQMHP